MSNEYVTIQVKLPKNLVDFVEALCKFAGTDIESFWKDQIIGLVEAIITDLDSPYTSSEGLVKYYKLEKVLGC